MSENNASKLASFPYYFAQRGYVHCRLAMLGRADEVAVEYETAAGLIQQLAETIEDAELKRGFLSNPEVSSVIAATNQPMRKEQ